MREYNLRDNVKAEKVEESGQVFTSRGPAYAQAGSYLVYGEGGTTLVDGDEFESVYTEVGKVEEEKEESTPEFNPENHTVSEVKEYLRNHPEDELRVKELEKRGHQRAGVLNY